ncbi:MAG: glycosyl hydrolase family 28 protein, partial [Kiritimatiellia bacterium]
NIVIRNCTIKRGHNLLAIGSELSGGVRNVYMHDVDYQPTGGLTISLLYIKTNHRRGGVVENIFIENAAATEVSTAMLAIDTDVLYQWRDLVRTVDMKHTVIRRIVMENVKLGKAEHGIYINGSKERPVEQILLKNVRVDNVTKEPRVLRNVEELREENVVIGDNRLLPASNV